MKANRYTVSRVRMGILVLSLMLFSACLSGFSLAGDVKLDCDIQSGSCQKVINGRTIDMDIFPKPVKAMTDLVFQVKVSGEPLSAPPFIDLGMPGMKMGPNRVIPKKKMIWPYMKVRG